MKEDFEATDKCRKSPKGPKSRSSSSQNNSGNVDIRPKPVICKSPKNVSVNKTNLIKTKKQWAPGTWQDDTHTSAFQPYKPSTLLTNLQRGNTRTEIQLPPGGSTVTFYSLAGQGELTDIDIQPGKIDTPDENGLTALMWAAGYGQLGSVKLLLKHGASPNYKGPHLETPLHFSAAHGHHDVVKLLLNHNADPNACEEEGNTPLIYGALSDNPHVCSELLTRGADITISNDYGMNAYNLADLKDAVKAKTVIENFLLEKVLSLSEEFFDK